MSGLLPLDHKCAEVFQISALWFVNSVNIVVPVYHTLASALTYSSSQSRCHVQHQSNARNLGVRSLGDSAVAAALRRQHRAQPCHSAVASAPINSCRRVASVAAATLPAMAALQRIHAQI